jgi:integrase/recombinase XerD
MVNPKFKLQQLFNEFISESQYSVRLSSETIRGYKEIFRLFISTMPEVAGIDFFTSEMVNEFFKRLQTRERTVGKNITKVGTKESTIKTYRSKLNVFAEWLTRKNIIDHNPIKHLKVPIPKYDDRRALEIADIQKLYSAITTNSKNALLLRRDIAMVSLLTYTGLRFGEFISLESRDIDFQKKLLFVRSQTSKSNRTRLIPIHATLHFHLLDYIQERNRWKYKTHRLIVSANSDTGLSKDGLRHWVKTLQRKSGVKFHLHQFRHSFACNLAQKDVNAVKIQKLLGHSSLEMTMTYLRSIMPEDLNEEINRLSI